MFDLRVLFNDGQVCIYYSIVRLTNLQKNSPFLYFENMYDTHGNGTFLSISDISCWELYSK